MSAKNGKPCKKCGTSEWYKDGHCVACQRERNHRDRQENPEVWREYARRYRQNNRPAINERIYRWRQANINTERARQLRYYHANADTIKEQRRRYQQANLEAHAAKEHRRRTRKTQAGGSYTASEFKDLCCHFGNKCLCCGRNDVKLTADHVVPVSRGGTSNIENIQPLCRACNSSKRDRIIDYRPNKGIGRWVQRKLFG